MEKEKMNLIWTYLYSTLTTYQIRNALKNAGLTWKEWLSFCKYMQENLK